MNATIVRSYSYRWVVLLAFMAVIFVNQILWITFALDHRAGGGLLRRIRPGHRRARR